MMTLLFVLTLLLAVACGAQLWVLHNRERSRAEARVAALAAAIDGPRAMRAAQIGGLGATPGQALVDSSPADLLGDRRRPLPPGAPGLVLALGAGVAAALLAIVLLSGGAGEVVQEPGLELLAMHHQRDGAALTVTGTVRHAGAAPPSSLDAELLALDPAGATAGSGRAALVFDPSGREARFRITIRDVPEAARYRVSFRSGADVVRHVDRR